MFNKSNTPIGKVLAGDISAIHICRDKWETQAVDDTRVIPDNNTGYLDKRTTIASEVSVSGVGTFYGKAQRTLTFKPCSKPGWWIKRSDQLEQLPILVTPGNVWTAHRNIVLRSGSPHNYMRMVEHIIALRSGLAIDDLLIETDSGDPPLFDRSSLDLVEGLLRAKIVPQKTNEDAKWITVKEPVTIGGGRGDFVTLLPAKPGQRKLTIDCAVNFNSAIGQQRIVFDVTHDNFIYGAGARTNATHSQLILSKTVGLLMADTRNLGYTNKNILIHGKKKYINEPGLMFNGRSYEPVWHRATLDLLAAIALLDGGRFVGTAVSYRAGHVLDTRFMTLLELNDMIVEAD